jgi:hypothetical protein
MLNRRSIEYATDCLTRRVPVFESLPGSGDSATDRRVGARSTKVDVIDIA